MASTGEAEEQTRPVEVKLTSPSQMANLKKMADDTTPKYPESGTCISFSTTKPKIWYNVLEECYFHNVSEQETDRVCKWKDSTNECGVITGAKLNYLDKHMSITISIFTTTGTLCVQGANQSLKMWYNQHYPALSNTFSEYLLKSGDQIIIECGTSVAQGN